MTTLYIPTKNDVFAVVPGATALDAFGRTRPVTEVVARQQATDGKWFVIYYTDIGNGASMSMSIKEGKLTRHAGLRETSADLDRIERDMLARGVSHQQERGGRFAHATAEPPKEDQ